MAPTRILNLSGLLLAGTLAAAGTAPAAAILPLPADVPARSEKDAPAPVDRGAAPGRIARATARVATMLTGGGSDAHVAGVFGPAVPWPINPIHIAVLPDGRLMSYGTNTAGKQGAGLVYDVWDPALGTGASAHLVLPNTTATDIFCSAQTVISATGELLITGGDRRVGGKGNLSNDRTTFFSPATNTVRGGPSLAYRRWYPTLVTLGGGDVLVLGGRQDPSLPATVPELYTPGGSSRALPGAASEAAFGRTADNWWYPRAFLAPSGRVVVIGYDGALFSVDPAGVGAVERLPRSTFSSRVGLPAVMYAPGKVLTLRGKARAVVVDINGAQPTVASTGNVSQMRIWSTLTVLPDGKVLATGGSADPNKATNVAYRAETWDPATGRWTLGAAATKPRLYHSTAILLPDATVLTAGGGSPGPVTNLNAEVYQPPYLFNRTARASWRSGRRSSRRPSASGTASRSPPAWPARSAGSRSCALGR
jgi:hypothetical protein